MFLALAASECEWKEKDITVQEGEAVRFNIIFVTTIFDVIIFVTGIFDIQFVTTVFDIII